MPIAPISLALVSNAFLRQKNRLEPMVNFDMARRPSWLGFFRRTSRRKSPLLSQAPACRRVEGQSRRPQCGKFCSSTGSTFLTVEPVSTRSARAKAVNAGPMSIGYSRLYCLHKMQTLSTIALHAMQKLILRAKRPTKKYSA